MRINRYASRNSEFVMIDLKVFKRKQSRHTGFTLLELLVVTAMIILLLGEIRAEEALPCLVEALEQEALAKDAAEALGNFGASVKAPLVKLLRTSDRPDVQAAAAKSLGRVGATTGEWVLTALFIDMLERPDLDIAVQIELVWALGKNPDRRALPILDNMYDRVWSVRSDDPQLQELRAAIDWSHRGARLGGHTDEY